MSRNNRNIKFKIEKWLVELSNFFYESWPIQWKNFLNPKIIITAFLSTPYVLKVIFFSFVVIFFTALGFFSTNMYLLVTVEVAAEGGEFRESVLSQRIQYFNPVLRANSELERKVNSLIYHPLYKVKYPDFLNDNTSELEIEPVLLAEPPTWLNESENPENQFQVLSFKLKDNLKWSDGSDLTVDDVIYSFERIKEEGGNQDFRDVFENYELLPVVNSKTEFELRPSQPGLSPNPQLIYLANFTPVSKNFYNSAKNAELRTSFRSLQPIVSSGYYTFPSRVQDPNSNSSLEVENPIRNLDKYSTIVLKKNTHNNININTYLDNYIIDLIDQITEVGGNQDNSLQKRASQKRVDLFNRFLTVEQEIDSESLANLSNLNQQIVGSNTFFNLYLNIQSSGNGLDGYFINQALRKYVICNYLNYEPSSTILKTVNSIDLNKRLVPLHFGDETNVDCSNIENELTTLTNSSGNQIYTLETDERSGIKSVKIFGQQPSLTMLALNEFRVLGEQIQAVMRDIGLPVTVNWVTSETLNTQINLKNYHLAFLPVTMLNRNPYTLYGLNSQNLSSIFRNERVEGRRIEEQLKSYTESNYQDLEARTGIVEFFQTQFVSVNLFQGKFEFNYSDRINNLSSGIPNSLTFTTDIYSSIPEFYVETKRRLR